MSRRALGWPLLGFAASLTIAGAATRLLRHRPLPWWWTLRLPGGHGTAWHVFWLGVIALCVAWLGLGWQLRRHDVPARAVLAVAAAWALPLALGPALFSLDLYSYLAQGALLHHGLNPYHVAPAALRRIHEGQLLPGVGTSWRHTTAPYGPLFLAVASVIAHVAGHHVTLGVTLLRLPELAGLGLLAWSLPRLARAAGADPARAVWLGVASPLMLLYLVGGGHNDALMTGLLAAGVALAVERRPLAGIALCALAAAVKLPAIAGAGLIGVCWLRAEPVRWRAIVALGAAAVAAILVAAGLLAGVGFSWISGSLFSTPGTVRTALTPATALSVTLAHVLHWLGVGASWRAIQGVATPAAVAIVLLTGVWVCLRVDYRRLPACLGGLLVAAALGGPAAWPWYLCWGAALLAADPAAQRSRWLPLALLAAAFPVMAGGQVAIALPQASRMLAVYAIAAALVAGGALRARLALPALRAGVPTPEGAG